MWAEESEEWGDESITCWVRANYDIDGERMASRSDNTN
jgi:hypothetical protein